MISPLPSSQPSSLRLIAPPRSHSEVGSLPVDGFVASAVENVQAAEKAWKGPDPSKHFVRKAVVTACLTGAGLAGAMAGAPGAMAAQVQHRGLVPSRDPAVRQLVASSLVTGRIPPGTVQERMAQLKPEVRNLLSRLPADVQQRYVDLDGGGRRWLSGQIGGRTETIFGKVKNRPSFVSGHFLFVNIFKELKSNIDSEIRKGTIPQEAQGRIHQAIDRLASLSSSQREVLAQALELEFKA
ncbi:hypothetical protein JST97_30895 [bacterium]|nr:hypothetical protein [bacterium]